MNKPSQRMSKPLLFSWHEQGLINDRWGQALRSNEPGINDKIIQNPVQLIKLIKVIGEEGCNVINKRDLW